MFVLDTDHVVIMQRRAQPDWDRVRERIMAYNQSAFHVTVVSVH